MSLLQHHKSILPVLVTVVEGPFSGYQCVLFGKDKMRPHFHYSRVKWAIRRNAVYQRCTWSYITFDEAKRYPTDMPSEVVVSLTTKRKEK